MASGRRDAVNGGSGSNVFAGTRPLPSPANLLGMSGKLASQRGANAPAVATSTARAMARAMATVPPTTYDVGSDDSTCELFAAVRGCACGRVWVGEGEGEGWWVGGLGGLV